MLFSGCAAQNLSQSIENSFGEGIYKKITGNLYVKDVGPYYQLIMCRSNGFSENAYDNAIVIFSESVLSKMPFNTNDEYEIQIPESRKYMVIYNVTKSKIHFLGVSDVNEQINSIKANPSLSAAITNLDCLGFGMTYMAGNWSSQKIAGATYKFPFNVLDYSNNNNPVSPENIIEPGNPVGVSCKIGSCTSGGAGSSTCSITEVFGISCSVSCNSGYYACCASGPIRCYCCKIPTTPQ